MAKSDPSRSSKANEGPPGNKLQLTRARDLLAIGVIAMVAGYLLVRWNYGRLPVLPRLAGLSASVVGIGELLAGFNIRARLRPRPGAADAQRRGRTRGRSVSLGWADDLTPLPPLVGARAVQVAKASSLAGAGLAGLWSGLLLYVLPSAGAITAAGSDTTTGLIGVISALVMTAGALWLERCCVNPPDPSNPEDSLR